MELRTEYFADDGTPLVNPRQAAELAGVRPVTVYAWEYRRRLEVRGLDRRGGKLYSAADIAALARNPGPPRRGLAGYVVPAQVT